MLQQYACFIQFQRAFRSLFSLFLILSMAIEQNQALSERLRQKILIFNSIQLICAPFEDFDYSITVTPTKQGKEYSLETLCGGKHVGREDIDYIREQQQKRSHLYSPLTASQKIGKSFQENYKYDTQNEEQGSDSSYIPSHNTPFSQLASVKNSQAPQMSEKSLTNMKNDSALYDSINEKDIFSFRTQKDEQSPLINKSKIKRQSPKTYKDNNINPSKSRSEKSSVNNSRKSSINHSNNSHIGRKAKESIRKAKESIDYDGVGQIYEPSDMNKSLQHRSSPPKNGKKPMNPPPNRHQLFQKILNRLKFSSCVINRIDRANRSSNIFLLQNRLKLQKQKRSSLISDILRQTEQSPIWK